MNPTVSVSCVQDVDESVHQVQQSGGTLEEVAVVFGGALRHGHYQPALGRVGVKDRHVVRVGVEVLSDVDLAPHPCRRGLPVRPATLEGDSDTSGLMSCGEDVRLAALCHPPPVHRVVLAVAAGCTLHGRVLSLRRGQITGSGVLVGGRLFRTVRHDRRRAGVGVGSPQGRQPRCCGNPCSMISVRQL